MMRRIALGLAVAALVAVGVLGVVASVLRQPPSPEGPARPAVQVAAPRAAPKAAGEVPVGWERVDVEGVSYAVPPSWTRRPADERVAYREDGAVLASGRGASLLSRDGCVVAWATLADPVRSSNVAGAAEATALAWARGYAGLPGGRVPAISRRGAVELAGGTLGRQVRVPVGLDDGAGCAGRRAELTVVAAAAGDTVVALVLGRYLDVPGAPDDPAYDAVAASLALQ